MEQVLESHWLWAAIIDFNCNRSVNKSNHPVQNPLLLVTQPPHTCQYIYVYIAMLSGTFEIKQFRVTIATACQELTLYAILSYVVDHGWASNYCLSVSCLFSSYWWYSEINLWSATSIYHCMWLSLLRFERFLSVSIRACRMCLYRQVQ
jgi:hypothetical protein